MDDLYHYWGNDLTVSATGDLLAVEGSVRGQQRVLRRLLTNPGDYIFHPDYGAGLPARVGDTLDIPKLRALIRGQMLLEEAVSSTPPPEITLQPIANGVSCRIQYTDAASGEPVVLSFSLQR